MPKCAHALREISLPPNFRRTANDKAVSLKQSLSLTYSRTNVCNREQCTRGRDRSEMALLKQCKQQVCDVIEQESEKLNALSQDIWKTPELAYKEHTAHQLLTSFFSSRAWEVQAQYHLDTAFRAQWTSEATDSPCLHVGFLCEYDALPGIGHACGHNLIAEVGAAAALGLRGALQSVQPPQQVQITVLGTPAEEDGGGKIDLLKAGAFEDMDVVLMAHPGQGDAGYIPAEAIHDVNVKYYGKASHASAYPWEGINALDAAILAYNNISVLRQQMKPTWRVHGIIKNGGVKPNIIPDYTELEFYLRAPSLKDLADLREKAHACFNSAATATGCKVELSSSTYDYYDVLPSKTLAKTYKENGKQLGMQFASVETELNSLAGSTDFGNVTYEVPGLHPYFSIGSNAFNHTEEYTEAAGSEEAQYYTLRTAKSLAMTALDVIFNTDLLESIRQTGRVAKEMEDIPSGINKARDLSCRARVFSLHINNTTQ
ncbi:peptidase M20 domain-containing protein 2-like [Bufo bufo]|uniref:peptidase M20 domain-containing protein 2-like n=1 Tax=Bufo bufo TaxID=8384 RepID=UPI001ABDF750|nr:peptidase M20 domain-containing protein 2-like [Bufo bufo]